MVLLSFWLCAGAQTRTVQLPHGKLVYTITNVGDTFSVEREGYLNDRLRYFREVNSIIVGDKLSAGTMINIDVSYYPDYNGEGVCSELNLEAYKLLTCVNPDFHDSLTNKHFKGTRAEDLRETGESFPYYSITRISPHKINRTFRVNQDITEKEDLFIIMVEYYVRNGVEVEFECFGGYDLKQRCSEDIGVDFVDDLPAATEFLDVELIDILLQYLELNEPATPEQAVVIAIISALLSLLLGGAGAVGGGAGGIMPPPIDDVPASPPTGQNPYQGIEDKYVTRHPDGSITVRDPVTGEQRLYLPDGKGGYDNPLGGGYRSEADMLEHLAMLDRNSETLSQDAATAARNQAEQHAQWEAQNARDLERGYSDEMAEYRKWKADQERELKKEERISKLAGQYGVEATEEAVKRAIKEEQIKASIESAKQMAESAKNDLIIVGLESTKNVAATSLVLIPMALSGVGAVSVTTMAKVKIVQSCYTMASSVIDKVGDAYVNGENMGMAAVHGAVIGTVSVAQNYAGNMGGLGKEAAVVIGGEGFKAGYEEYTSSGDLKKTLDATVKGLKDGAKTHAINKTIEFGFNKAKSMTSSKPTVEGTRAHADATGKTLTSSKSAATRAQDQVTSAQGRLTKAQQNVTRSQQQVVKATGKVNTANNQLRTANNKMTAAQQKLNQAKTPSEVSRAKNDLAKAQKDVAQAQQNVTRANSELKTAQRVDTATKRVAMNAEHDLQKAQMGAQKAQSDLKVANEQHNQALRDAYAAEQQAQVDKYTAQMTGNDVVSGGRAVEEHLKNEGYIPKDDE